MITPEIPGVTILDELGRGGFSVVYRAEQAALSRIVAAKVLSLDPTDTDLVDTFMAEARNIGELAARPDVVTVYETGLDSAGRPYLLLQYLPGGSLAERLKERGTLTVAEAVTIGSTVAGVLVAAHDQGILHCDLKPANLLFDANGRPVLADFGIARATAAADSSRSMAFLTPDHAAPELWEGRPPSVATDLYALGSMLHQLLVGRAPFQDPNGARLPPLQVMRRVLAEPAPSIVRPDVPPRLARLIQRLLAKGPSDRPELASAVFDELRLIELEIDAGTIPNGGASTDPHQITSAMPAAVDDDRTRRRVRPIDASAPTPPTGVPSAPGMIDPVAATASAAADAAAEVSPGSRPEGIGFGDGEPPRRTRISPFAVLGVVAMLIAGVTALVVFWPDQDPADGPRGGTTTTRGDTVLGDPAPVLKLSGEIQRDGATRILDGTMTGPQPWYASIQVLEGESATEPLGLVIVGGDSQNRMQVAGSSQDVRMFVSEMTLDGGDAVPLPSDRRLCFRSMPDDPSVDPTTACDPG